MKTTNLNLSVAEAVAHVRNSLSEKGFTIFAEIDHQANAQGVELELAEARTLIFGNPLAGTKLMQKDITMALDLPIRLALVSNGGQTQLLHQTAADYSSQYAVEGHPVLEKIEELFAALEAELSN
ncbi:DUF302 domain-containing protein [Bacterioplanoides sp.]|uniref:DUF302 domain-containing protein n=1 Tax=Bacterioplanoides sp. TaxID=2066072 RepID=UPI003B5CFC2A